MSTEGVLTETRGLEAMVIVSIFLVIGAAALLLRYFSRFRLIKRCGIDDCFIGLAMVWDWTPGSFTGTGTDPLQLMSLGTGICQIRRKNPGLRSKRHIN
jgi:hypothetical protein